MNPTLLDLLSLVNDQVLDAIRLARLAPQQSLPALAQQLAEPEAIQAAYRALPVTEKTIMDRLLLRGTDQAAPLQIELVSAGLIESDGSPKVPNHFRYIPHLARSTSRRFSDVTARLLTAGLVFTGEPSFFSPQPLDFGPGETLCVPAEVLSVLPQPESKFQVLDDSAASTRRIGHGNLAHLRFFALWEHLSRQPLRLTIQGEFHRLGLRKASRALNIGGQTLNDREAQEITEFYATLATGLGILETRDGLLVSCPEPSFLGLPQADFLFLALEAFHQRGRLAEATELANDVGQAKRTAAAQRALLKFLQVVPAGVWISFDSFSQQVSLWAPELLRPRAAQALPPVQKWSDYERPFITESVQGPFHWLGACDIALDAAGQAIAFRVSADGLATLLGVAPQETSTPGLIVVQPTFQVVALPRLDFRSLIQLSAFADLTRLAEAPEFKLTKSSLYRAAQAGLTLEQIVDLLQQWSHSPLPGNVQREMEEWVGRHARVTLRHSAPLLQTESEALLDQLLTDPALAPFFGQRLAPTIVELALDQAHGPGVLWRELLARGELAMQMPPAAPVGAWRVTAEGELQSAAALPDPLWLPLLQRVATPGAAAGEQPTRVWTITAEKVKAVVDKNATAEPFLALLRQLAPGPLPAELVQRIERWARPPEKAQVGHVTLLRVGTAEAAIQLLADRSLRGALKPLPGADSTWLVVKEDTLSRVRARLAEWEVIVSEGVWD